MTYELPIAPAAPGLLSTMTVAFRMVAIRSPILRAKMSPKPPAWLGTTIVIALEGYSAALAAAGAKASKAATIERPSIQVLPLLFFWARRGSAILQRKSRDLGILKIEIGDAYDAEWTYHSRRRWIWSLFAI